MELPGAPKGEIVSHGAMSVADSLMIHIRSPKDIVLGFELDENGSSVGRAYVGAFDGKSWKDLSPRAPTQGFWDIQRQPDGGLWLHTGKARWLRRTDDHNYADDWVDVCPSVQGADGLAPTVGFDPTKRPWLFGKASIVEYAEGQCLEHRLPTLSHSAIGDSCYVTNLQFLPNGEPVAVRFCGRSGRGESTLLLERTTETVILR
jgi:hypothetical protein